jgi:hypothetical protein
MTLSDLQTLASLTEMPPDDVFAFFFYMGNKILLACSRLKSSGIQESVKIK